MERLRNRLPRPLFRALIGIVGGVVLIAGIIMIPYPGPGWVVVFIGLAILAQEFPWAERALYYARGKYDRWLEWVKLQHWGVKALLFCLTCIIVVATIWLLNGYGLINAWLHLGWNWLNSPFVR
jgi:uncharacterized protein (TIGR02611 family)